jgi:hypothetical protein
MQSSQCEILSLHTMPLEKKNQSNINITIRKIIKLYIIQSMLIVEKKINIAHETGWPSQEKKI